ncbi:MAG: glutaredoxin family protein [Gammaproteobacteria bacterium]
MLEDLEAACRGREIDLEIIDVDSDPALVARYGNRVPVLLGGGAEICAGRLDSVALETFLRRP